MVPIIFQSHLPRVCEPGLLTRDADKIRNDALKTGSLPIRDRVRRYIEERTRTCSDGRDGARKLLVRGLIVERESTS